MIRVELKNTLKEPARFLLLNDEYLPFSLILEGLRILPETIYARNISGENFIEFRFDKGTRRLYEIALIALQPNSVSMLDNVPSNNVDTHYFECFIKDESELDISEPIRIFRCPGTLCIVWGGNDLNYFRIAENCVLGIGQDSALSAVVLTSLSEKQIEEIIKI